MADTRIDGATDHSSRRRVATMLACLSVALLCVAPRAQSATRAAPKAAETTRHTVVIEAVRYQPQDLVVKRGDRVTWVNKDPFPHTVTAPMLGSHSIPPGESWTYVATKSGEIAYHCEPHPTMKGTLKIE